MYARATFTIFNQKLYSTFLDKKFHSTPLLPTKPSLRSCWALALKVTAVIVIIIKSWYQYQCKANFPAAVIARAVDSWPSVGHSGYPRQTTRHSKT